MVTYLNINMYTEYILNQEYYTSLSQMLGHTLVVHLY